MNQQQLIEQKAEELQNAIGEYYMSKDWGPHGCNNYELHESVPFNTIEKAFKAGAEWMQGEGERLRESIDIEQLIPELMDKRVEEVMREAFGKTTIWDKTIYEGENAYYLSRKQIAEDLLDKFYIIPKPQTEHE